MIIRLILRHGNYLSAYHRSVEGHDSFFCLDIQWHFYNAVTIRPAIQDISADLCRVYNSKRKKHTLQRFIVYILAEVEYFYFHKKE
jgi:hypothetical protein